MTSDTKLVERLRANLEIARDHGLSLPGEPAWMLEQERQQSAISALQNYESYLPQLLDALSSTHPTSDNRSEMVELLPCPFCGNEPEIDESDPEEFMHEISCSHCDITMMASAVHNLREAWNTRTSLPGEIRRDALEEAAKAAREAMGVHHTRADRYSTGFSNGCAAAHDAIRSLIPTLEDGGGESG